MGWTAPVAATRARRPGNLPDSRPDQAGIVRTVRDLDLFTDNLTVQLLKNEFERRESLFPPKNMRSIEVDLA